MTWTYGGDPNTNNRDEVRYLVGDTDTTDQQVSDEEIAYAIGKEPNNILAAARTAGAIASEYARKANSKSVGDLNIDYSSRVQRYRELEKELRQMAAKQGAAPPYVGGISISDKDTVKEDSDRTEPRFSRGMFNNGGDKDLERDKNERYC